MTQIPETCLGFDEDLSAWIDDELEPARAAHVRLHVGSCTRCTERVAKLRLADARLRERAAQALAADVDRLARLRERIGPVAGAAPVPPSARFELVPPRAPARRRRWLLPSLAAAAASGLFALLVLRGSLEGADEQIAGRGRHAAPPAPEAPAPEPVAEDPTIEGELLALDELLTMERTQVPRGASVEHDPAVSPRAGSADSELATLEAASEEDLALALALDEALDLEPEDIGLVEQLETVERIEAPRPEGRG
jgi:hypothetical protein